MLAAGSVVCNAAAGCSSLVTRGLLAVLVVGAAVNGMLGLRCRLDVDMLWSSGHHRRRLGWRRGG